MSLESCPSAGASNGGTPSMSPTWPARSAAMRAAPSGIVWNRIVRKSGCVPQYASFFSNSIDVLRFHSTIFHGPVPTGRSFSPSTPFLSV